MDKWVLSLWLNFTEAILTSSTKTFSVNKVLNKFFMPHQACHAIIHFESFFSDSSFYYYHSDHHWVIRNESDSVSVNICKTESVFKVRRCQIHMVYFCICIFCIKHARTHTQTHSNPSYLWRQKIFHCKLNISECQHDSHHGSLKKEKLAQAFGRLEMSGSKATGESVGKYCLREMQWQVTQRSPSAGFVFSAFIT